jgi:hypothetical protein
MRENLLLMRRKGTSCTLSPSFGTTAGFEHRRLAKAFRDPQPIADSQEWPPVRKFRMADRGHRARKAKSAQFVSSSFLDCICCCCCITGLPSLGLHQLLIVEAAQDGVELHG